MKCAAPLGSLRSRRSLSAMLRACSALAALSAAAAVPEGGESASGWKLQMLHDAAEQDGAVCLDGTVSSSAVVSFTASETPLRCAGSGLLHPAGRRRGRQELQDPLQGRRMVL